MSSIPYINPLSPVQIGGTISVPRDVNFGVTYSTNLIGGYMEVDTLSNLTYTIPSGTSGLTQFSGNSIPILFVKGNGSAYSPDVLFLNNDNISSGRRKIGMLVFVRDQGQIYQYNIDGYDTLWNSATAATGTVSVSYLGTTVNNTTVAGQNFINAWTASTIDGVGGYTASNAKWKKYYGTNLALTGGSFNSITGTLTLTNITGGTQSLTGFGSGGGISGDYLPLSGGTVTGGTIFTGGLSANTISATTYYNLPSQSGTGVNALSYSQTTGRLTLTKNDATTLTAGTFTYLTGISYSNNVITSTNNLGSSSTLTINSVTGLTINGNLSVTGTTSSGTISATTYQNLPLRVSGTGTQDYVTKWDGTGNGISNSQIYDTGGFVGIATVTPSYGEKMSIYTNNKGILIDSLCINTINESFVYANGNYTSWGTGGNEIAIGGKEPLLNSTGNNNIAIGRAALKSNTTGSRNIAIGGDSALSINDSGSRNIAIGYFAMENNYDGSTNVAIGDLNLQQNTSGSNNTAVGYTSMVNNTDGTWNVAVGVGTLNLNNSGSFNTMIGIAAGNSSLTDRNTMIGSNAGTNTTSGDENTIIGSSSFISNTTGRANTSIGTYSLYSTDGGDGNVTMGHSAGFSNTTGGYNVIIGTEAAYNNDGSNNIFIGYNVAVGDTASSNKLNIGDTIFGDLSTKIIGINKANPTNTLDVNGTFTVSSAMTASNTVTIIGNKGSVITNGGTTTAFMTFSGSNTVGGTGYTDFIRVTNTAAGATTPSKTFRVSNSGGLEIVNNGYTAQILSITDSGIMAVAGGNYATTSSNDAQTNYLSFGNNSLQLYDDGNPHIHSRVNGSSLWINTNNAQLNLLTQSPTSTGSIGTGIAIATTTLNGYVTINTGRTVTTSVAYGYLTTGGTGTYTGGSQTISISLYANNRIWGQEIDAFSDERMKDIHGEITLEEGIKLVKNLKPIKYNWKEGDDRGIKAGYSAQQVIKSGFDHLIGLIPTEGLEERIDDDGFVSPKDTQFAMNYDQVTPYHGVVIKHLLYKIEQLEIRIKDLENR